MYLLSGMKKPENSVRINKIFRIMIKLKGVQWIFIFPVILFISGCAGIYENGKELAADTQSYIQEITVKELLIKIENSEDFFLIDVRQPNEFEKSNIPYSTLIPRGILEFRIENESFWKEEQWYVPEKDAEIIIYCKKGDRGILATKTLMELGFSNVKNLKGGMIAWDPDLDSGTDTKHESGGCGG